MQPVDYFYLRFWKVWAIHLSTQSLQCLQQYATKIDRFQDLKRPKIGPCQENDTRSGRRFACRLYPSHGPLRFITSHSFRASLCHAKNEAPEEEAVPLDSLFRKGSEEIWWMDTWDKLVSILVYSLPALNLTNLRVNFSSYFFMNKGMSSLILDCWRVMFWLFQSSGAHVRCFVINVKDYYWIFSVLYPKNTLWLYFFPQIRWWTCI